MTEIPKIDFFAACYVIAQTQAGEIIEVSEETKNAIIEIAIELIKQRNDEQNEFLVESSISFIEE